MVNNSIQKLSLEEKKISIFTKVLSFLFPFYLLFSSYSISGINLCYYIYIPIIILAFLDRNSLFIERNTLYFLLVIVIQEICVLLFMDLNKHNITSIEISLLFSIITTLLVFSFRTYVDIKYMLKVYTLLGTICAIVLCLQAFKIYILNLPSPPIMLFEQFRDRALSSVDLTRPSSFFNEPQHYASFLLPLIYFKMIEKKYMLALFLSISIVFSGSSQGIIILLSCWIYFFIFIYTGKNKGVIIFTLAISIIFVFLIENGLVNFMFGKILKTDFSTNIRIARGFGIWYGLPLKEKIIGIGNISVNEYILAKGYSLFWYRDPAIYSDALDFISSFSANFIFYGLFGGIAFIVLLLKLKTKIESQYIGLILIITISSFTQTLVFNSWYVFYFSLLLLLIKVSRK